mmetsp:Transcript_55048/g.128168  ORF Transcript_55048/g.128168 Transcript_55048/m.128168 type:complete len:98 (+) Transcript_55048:45-338(+)
MRVRNDRSSRRGRPTPTTPHTTSVCSFTQVVPDNAKSQPQKAYLAAIASLSSARVEDLEASGFRSEFKMVLKLQTAAVLQACDELPGSMLAQDLHRR